MSLVPPYIASLQPYKAGKPIDEVQRELGLTRVIKLASNENPLGSSPLAIAAIHDALRDLHFYPNGGYNLRVAVAERYGLKIDHVIPGSGSEGVMATIVRTFLTEEDEVLTTESAFIGFQVLARSRGVGYNTVPYREWRYDLEAMAGKITPRTKLIYIANPNNPTGTMVPKREFERFYARVPRHILIVMDEAYFEYAIGNSEYPDSLSYRYDNVITLRTFSKVYGLAGIRIGYGIAHEDIVAPLLKVKLPFEPSSLAQAAGVAALRDENFLRESVSLNAQGRTFLYAELKNLGYDVVPSETNFLMVSLTDERNVNILYDGLLHKGIVIRPLRPFGLPNCVRISVGSEEENRILIDAMKTIRVND